MIGAFMNGEIGPYVRYGYAGWMVAGAGLQLPSRRTAVAPTPEDAGEDGAGSDGLMNACLPASLVGGRLLQRDPCTMQGWTSMYAVLG